MMLELNQAAKEDLMRLPDMTEPLADAVIELRERLGGYQNVRELLLIQEMKPDYFEHTLMEYIYIENEEVHNES